MQLHIINTLLHWIIIPYNILGRNVKIHAKNIMKYKLCKKTVKYTVKKKKSQKQKCVQHSRLSFYVQEYNLYARLFINCHKNFKSINIPCVTFDLIYTITAHFCVCCLAVYIFAGITRVMYVRAMEFTKQIKNMDILTKKKKRRKEGI